jgi:hypothetical protein
LWRAGLGIQEALALADHALDHRRGSLLLRNGKGGRRREVGRDKWGWEQLRPWLKARAELPVGPLFCIIDGPLRARAGDRSVPSVPPAERLLMQRVPGDRWLGYRTVAGMVAVITAVLAGSTAALAAIVIFDHSLAAAVISGTLVALPTMIAMIRYQDSAWERAATEPLRPGED